MQTLDLTNLPLDPAIEAGKEAAKQLKNTPSEKTFNLIEDAMKSHPTLTREEALEAVKEFGY